MKTIKALFKKRPGLLTIAEDLITWKQTDSTNEISFQFQQIKTQMAHKTDKTLLKIVLINGDSVQLRFEELTDRDVLVALIKEKESTRGKQVVLDEFEIQARQDLLTVNPQLGQVHKELVVQGVISEQEFWSLREHDLSLKRYMIMQTKGTSSMLTADDWTSGSQLEIKITVDDIHAIFTQYPGVQKAFLDYVPTKMTEMEFWTAYFQSKYFHRNRVGAVREAGKGDIFDKYMDMDNLGDALHPDINFVPKNELLNLTTTIEDHYEAGNSPDITMKAGRVKEALPLIRKFNRHSSLILSQSTENPVFTSVAIQKEIQLHDLEKHSDPRYESLNIPTAVVSLPASVAPEISKFPLQFDLKVPFESMSSSDIIPTLDDKPNAGQQIRQSSKCDRVLNIADELLRHFWASTRNKPRMESIRMHLQKIKEEIDAVIKEAKQNQWTLYSIRTCVQHALQFKLDLKPPIS